MNHSLARYVLHLFTVLCLGFGLVSLPVHPAKAADIVINTDISALLDVAGNGLGPSGIGPFNGDPNNNTVTVTSGGVVDGNVFGGPLWWSSL